MALADIVAVLSRWFTHKQNLKAVSWAVSNSGQKMSAFDLFQAWDGIHMHYESDTVSHVLSTLSNFLDNLSTTYQGLSLILQVF